MANFSCSPDDNDIIFMSNIPNELFEKLRPLLVDVRERGQCTIGRLDVDSRIISFTTYQEGSFK